MAVAIPAIPLPPLQQFTGDWTIWNYLLAYLSDPNNCW